MNYSFEGILFVIGTFIFSAVLGRLVIPRIVLISKKRRLFDYVSARKSHQGSVPRLGGLSFFPIFLTSFTTLLGLRYSLGYMLEPQYANELIKEFLFVTGGSAILMFAGMADDIRGLSYKNKFMAQFGAAVLLIASGLWIDDLGGLFGICQIPAWIGIPLTLLVVVYITNAYNLIDGIDGLCSGLSIVALGMLGAWYIYCGLFAYAMIAAAILGVLVMFFLYNTVFKRLKIFMGDTGSQLLGFLIAFLALKFLRLCPENTPALQPLPVFISLVFIPAFDALRVFIVRVSKGLSPFFPDRKHIHHQFLDLGFGHLRATAMIILIQIFFIAINVFLSTRWNINLLLGFDLALWLTIMYAIQFRRIYLGKVGRLQR